MKVIPPAKVLAEDLTKASLRKGSPNLMQMPLIAIGRQVTSELMDSHHMGGLSGTKGDRSTSSQQREPAPHSSGLGSSSSTASSNSHDPNRPLKEVSYLTLVIPDENEFPDDPHQIIPTEEEFALPLILIPGQDIGGYVHEYLLPAQVTKF